MGYARVKLKSQLSLLPPPPPSGVCILHKDYLLLCKRTRRAWGQDLPCNFSSHRGKKFCIPNCHCH